MKVYCQSCGRGSEVNDLENKKSIFENVCICGGHYDFRKQLKIFDEKIQQQSLFGRSSKTLEDWDIPEKKKSEFKNFPF